MLSRVSLHCFVAYTSVHVFQTEQVASQRPEGKIRYRDMMDFGKNTDFLSAQIHLFPRWLHTKTNVCNSQIGLQKVCVCCCVSVCVCVCVCVRACRPPNWK